jgi:hypothetical protein
MGETQGREEQKGAKVLPARLQGRGAGCFAIGRRRGFGSFVG